jgi:hypothetical protein
LSLQNLIVGISGEKGAGKSTLLEQLTRQEPALALIDTLGEHQPWCPMFPGSNREQIIALAEPPETFKWSFLIDPDHEKAHFNALCRAAYRSGDMTFVVEEVDRYSTPVSDWPGLKIMYDYGRHRRVNLLWATRNLATVSRKLTSQTDVLYFFRQNEPKYVRDLEERIGALGKLYRDISEDLALEVLDLPKFSYILCAKGYEPSRGVVEPPNAPASVES